LFLTSSSLTSAVSFNVYAYAVKKIFIMVFSTICVTRVIFDPVVGFDAIRKRISNKFV
jgi:hypothetical protein